MKKIIIFFLLFPLLSTTFSQQITPSQPLTKQDYLQKSKNQKTAGWILRGSGLGLLVAGIVWGGTDFDSSGPDILFVASGVCILSSIPLFIASRKNKRLAMSMSFNWQSQQMHNGNFARRQIPSLTLKTNL